MLVRNILITTKHNKDNIYIKEDDTSAAVAALLSSFILSKAFEQTNTYINRFVNATTTAKSSPRNIYAWRGNSQRILIVAAAAAPPPPPPPAAVDADAADARYARYAALYARYAALAGVGNGAVAAAAADTFAAFAAVAAGVAVAAVAAAR